MSRLISGSWVCFNECWSKSGHPGEKTSIPVVLNYQSAAFILKRANIKCQDPKEQDSDLKATDEMHLVFGNFPSNWYCDCYKVCGLTKKMKLPVIPDLEMLEQWVAMTDTPDPSSESVESPTATIAKIEVDGELIKTELNNSDEALAEPVMCPISMGNVDKCEIEDVDITDGSNSSPYASSELALLSEKENHGSQATATENDELHSESTNCEPVLTDFPALPGATCKEEYSPPAIAIVASHEDGFVISDSSGEEIPMNDNNAKKLIQLNSNSGHITLDGGSFEVVSDYEDISSDSDDEERMLDQKDHIARIRAKQKLEKKNPALKSVNYVEKRIGKFLVDWIDIRFCFESDAKLRGSLKKEDRWGGVIKRVTFRAYPDVKYFSSADSLKPDEVEAVIKIEESDDLDAPHSASSPNAGNAIFHDMDSLELVGRSSFNEANQDVVDDVRHACPEKQNNFVTDDDQLCKEEMPTYGDMDLTHSFPDINANRLQSSQLDICKDELRSENNWDNILSFPSNEADHFHESSDMRHFNGLRLTSDTQFEDEIYVRNFEDSFEDDIDVPRPSAASGSAMSILAMEERQKRRRICRKLENNDEIDDSAPFYQHGSYSELGEARRRVLSKDVCVPIQCSSVLSQIAYKKIVVNAAERNLQMVTDFLNSCSSEKYQSIIISNEEYKKEAGQLRQLISQMKKDADNAVDGSNVVLQATSRRNTHTHIHGRLRSQFAGTNPLQLYLPDGCNSVPDSWFQYSSFRGVALYSTRDSVTREAAALINKISNTRTLDSNNDAEKSVIRLIKEKMKNKKKISCRRPAIQKVTMCKPRRNTAVIPLANRFVQYAVENGSISAAMRRQMYSSDYAENFNKMNDWENNNDCRKAAPAFIQPSRVHFDLELVKSWKKGRDEDAPHQSVVHPGNSFYPGYSGGLEPLQDQECSSLNSFAFNENSFAFNPLTTSLKPMTLSKQSKKIISIHI